MLLPLCGVLYSETNHLNHICGAYKNIDYIPASNKPELMEGRGNFKHTSGLNRYAFCVAVSAQTL